MAADLQKIKTTRRLRVLFKSALTRRINKNTHMNTRLRLTALAAVFAFLTPPTFTLHARVLGPEAIEVPDGTRKCIKPKDRAPKPTDLLFAPLTCLEPVVNVSATAGNQAESFVVVNPTNTNNLVAISNTNANSIFRAYSFDGGTTWTRGTIATNVACCDGQAVWDTFGNLFVVYINNSVNQINVILSTDGGVTFSAPLTVGTGSIDQPSIAVGNGSVWVDWNQSGSMVARGAPVTGLGVWGPFNAQQAIPSATGSFGGIAVGPGPNGGKVIVTYQSPTGGQGPSTIYANVDADGLGAGGFGPRITVTSTNVGGFDYIPAQSERSIDAEAGMVWDATGGPFNNRIYLVYTEEPVNESNDTEIYVRTSTDDGGTWTAPVRVNDDPLGPIRSQFLPYIVLDRTTGTVAVGFHDCRNDNGVPGPGGTNNIPNDDAEYYGTYSTDGGATWATNVRLSGGFSNATASGNGIDFGDYVGLDAHAGKLYTVWADNANCDGTNPNGTLHAFDLYTNTLMLPTPPVPSSAVSRKVHGAAGTFDVPLPLTGNVGVECRSGGATNDYQMIINFANSVTVGSASVTSGTGSVSSFSVSGSQVTVNLTGVNNVQRITVTLFNVNDGTHMGNVSVSMGVLVGDVNGNGLVNASDVSLTKSQVGAPVSGSNFREDVNVNGTISSTDVALVKSKVGTALPP
jgi:Dockerin type I domain